jgi:hypothetical protein
MARTYLAAVVDASGIEQAVVFARIGGCSQALLVPVNRVLDNNDQAERADE